MTAEERLAENNIHRIDNTSRGTEIGWCGPLDLAREAIALLRDIRTDYIYHNDIAADRLERLEWFLDGEER